MQYQGRGLNVFRVFQRRPVPVELEPLKYVSTEIRAVAVSAVPCTVVRNEVGDTTECDRGFEPVRVAHNPIRHVATITAASNSKAVCVDPGITFQCRINAVHDVDIVFPTPLTYYPAFKLLTITGRTSRISKQHCITLRRIDLKLVIPIDAILSRRPTVHAENHWVLSPVLPADRFYEEAIDVPVIRTLISEAF